MDENVSAGIRRQNLIQARRDAQKNEENVAKGTAQGPQLPSSEEKKKVISEPVRLDQEYRNFDSESPWEGTKYINLEDEKKITKDK